MPDLDGRLVSYRAELGRLAEIPRGEDVVLRLPRGRRDAVVTSRVRVKPKFDVNQWDGIDNLFDLADCQTGVESLRALISYLRKQIGTDAAITDQIDFLEDLFAEDHQAKLFYDERRRKTVMRMALRDQPTLDRIQGEVFRQPLNKQLLLLGPPGTGKTTTLIKRLAQKRTEEALTLDESEMLDRLRLLEDFRRETSWVMFSPTDLLKLYVRDSFAREGVPATNHNLRTWSDERRYLGREVLKFLRAGNRGRFTISDEGTALSSTESESLSEVFDQFSQFVDEVIVNGAASALDWMTASPDPEARRLADQVRSRLQSRPISVETLHVLADNADMLQSSLVSLEDRIKRDLNGIANTLLTPKADDRLRELEALLGDSNPDDDAEEDEDEEAEVEEISDRARLARRLLKLIRSLARERALTERAGKSGLRRRLEPWIGNRSVDDERLRVLGEKVLLERRVKLLQVSAPVQKSP